MPRNIDLPDGDPELLRLEAGGGLKAKTLQDRIRHTNIFKEFVGKEEAGFPSWEVFQHNDCDCWSLCRWRAYPKEA